MIFPLTHWREHKGVDHMRRDEEALIDKLQRKRKVKALNIGYQVYIEARLSPDII
jgi:hypothetical protein